MRRHAKVLFAVAMLFALLALSVVAQAAQVYVPAQSFSGPGSADGQLDKPRRAAVEQSTGNLFVADSGNGRVQVFDPDGGFVTAFGQAELDAPYGIAVYESGGQTEVYVSDPATNQILRYDSDEQAVPSFSVDAGFTSPAQGAGQLKVGDFAAALAVDPNNGDLWVADAGDDRAQRYSDTGAFELANDGSDSPGGTFTGLLDIAADSAGRLYAVDSNGLIANQPDGTPASGQSRVERFSAGGEHQLTLPGLTQPATVAVDLATDRVAVSADQNNVDYNGEPSLHVFDSTGAKFDELRMGPGTQYTTVHGLAWRSSDADVLAVNDFGYWNGTPLGIPSVNRFELAEEPTAAIDPVAPGGVTAISAEFTGTVNPGGFTTTAHFELSSDGGSSWKEMAEIPVCEVANPGDCTSDEAVAFTATGLTPNVSYSVRLVAESSIASIASAAESFTTDEAPPRAITDRAQRTSGSAVFNGRLNPYGLATTYYFEYGTSPGAYTASVPVSEDAAAGAGTDLTAVSQSVTGLAPSTTYYYRLVATSSQGTSFGEEIAVTTLATGQVLPDNYVEVGNFGKPLPGAGDAEFNEPRKLAVHEASGQILVVDQVNNRVQVFDPSGTSATYLTQFGAGVLNSPFGIAIDQGSGDVYVSSAGSNEIVKFERAEGSPPTFAPDSSFASPLQGSGAGQIGSFSSSLAVDQATGHLWVADSGNNRAQHFDASGGFVGSFDGSDSPKGAFTTLSDIAIDSTGAIVVAREPYVERFSPSGEHQLTIGGDFFGGYVDGLNIAVNPFDQILVGTGYQGVAIDIWENGNRVGQVTGFPGEVWGWGGLTFNQQDGTLYALAGYHFGCCGANTIRVLTPGTRPTATIDAVGAVGSTTAELSGSVNPQAYDTDWYFEYSKAGENRWYPAPYPYVAIGDGASAESVSHTLTDLDPNTDYEVRLVAINQAGKTVTAIESFTTADGEPAVGGLFAAPRTTTTARLNARINPHGLAATYRFEYGADTSYGTSVPTTLDGEAGNGIRPVIVAEELSGLQPGTTYHYRVVAESTAGTTASDDHTFTTRTAAEMTPPGRGIELVNQPDKGGQDVRIASLVADDSGVFWWTVGGAPGAPISVGLFRSERSLDTPTGWSSESLLPPMGQLTPNVSYKTIPVDWSDDGRSLIISNRDATDVYANLERSSRGNLDVLQTFKYRAIAATPLAGTFANQGLESSADMSKVFVNTSQSFDPDHVSPGEDSGIYNVYEIGDGTPELISRLPDGSTAPCGLSTFGFSTYADYQTSAKTPWVTPDGSHVLFTTSGDDCNEYPSLYLRDLTSSTTTLLSGSSDAGGGGQGQGPAYRAWPVGLSDDGSEVFFLTKTKAEDIDRNGSIDLYRWTEGDGSRCLTCATSIQVDSALASEDLSRVYFTSRDSIVPGLAEDHAFNRTNLYRWSEDGIEYVAPMAEEGAANPVYDSAQSVHLTPDGSIATFQTSARGVTADDPCEGQECLRLYRYDDRSGEIECIDCSPPGSPWAGGEAMYDPQFPNLPNTRNLSDDGSTIAFTSRAPLLPADINGGKDVYEWRNGRLSLVTDGSKEFSSLNLIGMSANATDVYFMAGGPRLTGFEVDRNVQLYDARVGGGFTPPAPPAECVEDACQGPLEPSPSLQGSGSASFAGPGNQSAANPRKRCGKNRQKKSKSKARCGKKRQEKQGQKKRNSNRRGG